MSKIKETTSTKISTNQPGLNGSIIFKEGGLVDWQALRDFLKKEGQIS